MRLKALGSKFSFTLAIALMVFLWFVVGARAGAQTPVAPVPTPPSAGSTVTPSVSPSPSSTEASANGPINASPIIVDGVCAGANLDVTSDCDDLFATSVDGDDEVNDIISNFINLLSVIVGIVAVIMIMVGGFRYIISGGEGGSVTSAKNTILYAIVGIVIVVFAQVIVRFVLNSIT